VLPDDGRIVERSLSWIRTALDRGVTAFVDVATSQLKSEVETTAPGAQVTVSDREFGRGDDDTGRTLLVDDASVLLSTVERSLPTVREETAIVSRGGVGSRIGSMVRGISRSRHRERDYQYRPGHHRERLTLSRPAPALRTPVQAVYPS